MNPIDLNKLPEVKVIETEITEEAKKRYQFDPELLKQYIKENLFLDFKFDELYGRLEIQMSFKDDEKPFVDEHVYIPVN